MWTTPDGLRPDQRKRQMFKFGSPNKSMLPESTVNLLTNTPHPAMSSETPPPSVPLLWSPRHPGATRTHALLETINTSLDPDANLKHYSDLYNWSIGASRSSIHNGTTMQLFWSTIWDECGLVGEKGVGPDDSLTVIASS